MSDEITITRKYVIYPIASDMKEWERKVRKYVSENYEKRIQLLEQKIKHSKIPKEEKENLRKELDNLKIKYDAFQADPVITQSEINTYTYGTVRTAMEEEARKEKLYPVMDLQRNDRSRCSAYGDTKRKISVHKQSYELCISASRK